MKSVRTEACHVGLFREFVGTACCTYGQSNTTNKIELIRSNLEESLNTSYQLSPNAPKFLGVSFEQLSSKDTTLQSELKSDFVTPFYE